MSTAFEHVNGYADASGGATMHETEALLTEIPQISPELEETYETYDPSATYYEFCGDDRPLTIASAEALDTGEYAGANYAVRTFGGAFGNARAVAVASIAAGQDTFGSFRGNFIGFTKQVASTMRDATNLVPSIHSAEKNEGNADHFDTTSENGLGCAYGAGAEAVTGINSNPAIVGLASQVIELLGSSPQKLAEIVAANEQVKDLFTVGGQKTFNVSREGAGELDLPVAVLQGDHAPVKKARIVINLLSDKVASPRKALELDMPTYNIDAMIECAAILKAYPNLDPRTLLEAKILDICATAEALASGENLHASDFLFERRGNFEEAVLTLEEIRQTALAA